MKIALITQREGVDQYGTPIDIMESSYIRFLNQLGYRALPVSNFESCAEKMFEISGVELLVLTGGGSLPTRYYKKDYGYERQPHRDQLEEGLLKTAFSKKIAVLAICRGMQFVNGYLGGKVSRLDYLANPRKNGCDHPVVINNSERIYVNNYHVDGIYLDDLAKQTEVLAMDIENGTVEAFTMREKNLLAIQWHPERPFKTEGAQEQSRRLIQYYLQKS